jgi:hypothetical protein
MHKAVVQSAQCAELFQGIRLISLSLDGWTDNNLGGLCQAGGNTVKSSSIVNP